MTYIIVCFKTDESIECPKVSLSLFLFPNSLVLPNAISKYLFGSVCDCCVKLCEQLFPVGGDVSRQLVPRQPRHPRQLAAAGPGSTGRGVRGPPRPTPPRPVRLGLACNEGVLSLRGLDTEPVVGPHEVDKGDGAAGQDEEEEAEECGDESHAGAGRPATPSYPGPAHSACTSHTVGTNKYMAALFCL